MLTTLKKAYLNHKGFTLVEMAIVLVVIGIILGAVLKGQDLVDNARSKQFTTKVTAWEVALHTYFDRKGRFPGDANKDGLIGDSDPQADITAAKFVTAPENTFVLGGSTFYVYVGNSGGATAKNYLIVCKVAACTTAYAPTTDSNDLAAMKYFESLDTSVDSTASATAGNVRGATAVTTALANTTFTALTLGASSADWLATTDVMALTYQFK